MYKAEADGLIKIRVWWLARQLRGQAYCASNIVWGSEDKEALRVNYHFDLRQDSGYRPELKLSYTIKNSAGGTEQISYSVYFTETDCHLGGMRFWFMCPLYRGQTPCARRVGVLYFNGRYFGCRHCLDLTYKSKSINYSSSSNMRLHGLDWYFRAQDLQESAKRKTWRGRETRKQRQLRKLYQKLNGVTWEKPVARRAI